MASLGLPVELWHDILHRMDNHTLRSFSLLSHTHRQLSLPFLFATLRIDHTASPDRLRDLSRRRYILKHIQNVYLCPLYSFDPESDNNMQRIIVAFRLCLAYMHQLRMIDLGNIVVSEYFFREIFTIRTLRHIAAGPQAEGRGSLRLNEFSIFERLLVLHIESGSLLRILDPAIRATAVNLTHLLIPLASFALPSILQHFTTHPPQSLTSIAVVDLVHRANYAILRDLLSSLPGVTELEIRSATCIASDPSFSTVLPKLRVLTCPAWLAEHLAPGRPLHTFKQTPAIRDERAVESLTILGGVLSVGFLAGAPSSKLSTLVLSSSCEWEQFVPLIKGTLPHVRFLSLCLDLGHIYDPVSRRLAYISVACTLTCMSGCIRLVERIDILCSDSFVPHLPGLRTHHERGSIRTRVARYSTCNEWASQDRVQNLSRVV
jgi:hypothetical protein